MMRCLPPKKRKSKFSFTSSSHPIAKKQEVQSWVLRRCISTKLIGDVPSNKRQQQNDVNKKKKKRWKKKRYLRQKIIFYGEEKNLWWQYLFLVRSTNAGRFFVWPGTTRVQRLDLTANVCLFRRESRIFCEMERRETKNPPFSFLSSDFHGQRKYVSNLTTAKHHADRPWPSAPDILLQRL